MDKKTATSCGTLYIVATPIGNLEDMSARAVRTLQMVDSILAEDTRNAARLLSVQGIKKPMLSFHAHNEATRTEHIIGHLLAGRQYALVSDAGTPLISDPGFTLVRAARAHRIPVVPVPGACAFVTALSAAGIPCDSFLFDGFLPAKQMARRKRLEYAYQQACTVVFYESGHRIAACMEDVGSIYGLNYEFVLAKELTKIHECFVQGNAVDMRAFFDADPAHVKGEFVLLLPKVVTMNHQDEHSRLMQQLLEILPLKDAVRVAEKLSGAHKNILYRLAVSIQNDKTGI